MNQGAALKQLADVLPPPAPGGFGWILAIAVTIIFVTAVVLFRLVKRRRSITVASPAHEALLRLAALRATWQARTLSDREAAYRLATVLRLGLKLPQLTAQSRPAVIDDDAQWRDTLSQLQALRYRDLAATSLSAHCFDHAERWLAAARRQAG